MAVIGLGIVGRRMLEQTARHHAMRVAAAWDVSAAARQAATAVDPTLPIATGAQAAIERLDVDLVYVAVPPLAHAQYVRAATAAGKAVFCEKPLGVDDADSESLVEVVTRAGVPNAMNFPFASSAAVELIGDRLRAPGFGMRAVEIQLRFARWPRDWQTDARWLERADQGGFTREVVSHFVYLLMRVLGEVRLMSSLVRRPAPEAAEVVCTALIECAGVPVTLSASVGGQSPDVVEARFIGEREELRLSNWYELRVFDERTAQGRLHEDLPADPRTQTYQAQLTQLQAMLAGRPHTLPDLRAGLRVQRIVEAMLR